MTEAKENEMVQREAHTLEERIENWRELHKVLSEKSNYAGVNDAKIRALGAQMMVDLPYILDQLETALNGK